MAIEGHKYQHGPAAKCPARQDYGDKPGDAE
jgi:hypothetical protein